MKSRKIWTILTLLLISMTPKVVAQNVQLHYDFGRNAATTTVEMFRPDGGGSTFFFVDMDYTPKVSEAYWEIAREFCFWQDSKVNWLSVHVEYNGGLNTVAGSFNNAILGGLTYSGHSKDWSKTWSLTASYKAIPGTIGLNGERQVNNFQITGVWNLDFFDHWLSFNGFADFWREARPWQGTEYIFITEPQLWVNLNKIKGWDKINLSLGTEVELSSNFVQKGFSIMPTIAAKWIF
ncbi:MAG: DUF5020 family protein [Alistipes sp.]|nr:DUF5020 family protein [Alistipes sp.]